MQKVFIIISGISGMIAVMLGALGAHALKSKISLDQLTSFETAVKYQMYHTLALLLIALLLFKIDSKSLVWSGWCFIAGIILFSGSIYLLSTKNLLGIENWNWLGPVTPIGGMLFIAGWFLILLAAINHSSN